MNKLTVPDTVDVRFMCMKGVHSTTCSDIPDKSGFIAALKHNEYLNWRQSSTFDASFTIAHTFVDKLLENMWWEEANA